MKLQHTIPIFINKSSKILILGSFPSIKSREYGFYYSHPQNRFYAVLGRLFNEDIPLSIKDRKAFLKEHHIALYDVIYECDIISSSDASIKNVIPIDIKSILDKYTNIKVIAINGNKAKQLYDKYLLEIAKTYGVKTIYLPSTSPANARMKIDDLIKAYSLIE